MPEIKNKLEEGFCPVCGKKLKLDECCEVESGNPVTRGAWDFYCEECGNSGIIDVDGEIGEGE